MGTKIIVFVPGILYLCNNKKGLNYGISDAHSFV